MPAVVVVPHEEGREATGRGRGGARTRYASKLARPAVARPSLQHTCSRPYDTAHHSRVTTTGRWSDASVAGTSTWTDASVAASPAEAHA